ncbi:sodium-dependent phosphate transport protein 1 isoform X1 [Theropithecus gelada]|uniref:sodium-dependent phosphate transport protein 1 isoform X1 n=1 Tax=Theropithecus gelada TaxID=9565 RepID=UPI000DC16484|nr:sodium-dependent phosphate transport protein 1 isoform X1 [Theropithecus gelada]
MQMDNQLPRKKVPGFCSFRYGLSFLVHCCNVITTAQRACLNLTMVVMVNSTDPHGLPNTSTKKLLDNIKNPVYNWSPDIQGIILSSTFYGFVIIQVPVGYFSGIYSTKKMIGFALCLSSVLSLLIPPAAGIGVAWVIVCRAVQGAAQGIVGTAQFEIYVKWAPPLERGRLTSMSTSGFLLGPFIVLLVTGVICESLGWPMVFYIFGACGCALCLLWFILFYDDPKDHPCISISEKEYITSSLVQQVSSSRQSLPIKAMLKSLPVWAISIGSFTFFWSHIIMTLYTPLFINSTLHVNIKENGFLSSLPYLFAWICGNLVGQLSDFFLTRNILSVIAVRKLFTAAGFLLPAIFGVCLPYLSSSFYGIVIFLILVSATGSFCLGGVLINGLDIAPRYFGFIKACSTLSGMLGGLIASTLTGLILRQVRNIQTCSYFSDINCTEKDYAQERLQRRCQKEMTYEFLHHMKINLVKSGISPNLQIIQFLSHYLSIRYVENSLVIGHWYRSGLLLFLIMNMWIDQHRYLTG